MSNCPKSFEEYKLFEEEKQETNTNNNNNYNNITSNHTNNISNISNMSNIMGTPSQKIMGTPGHNIMSTPGHNIMSTPGHNIMGTPNHNITGTPSSVVSKNKLEIEVEIDFNTKKNTGLKKNRSDFSKGSKMKTNTSTNLYNASDTSTIQSNNKVLPQVYS